MDKIHGPVHTKSVARAGLLMLVIVTTSICCWEYYLRAQGFVIGYNDDNAIWAKYRARVYGPPEKTTVFIGSSRIKFDLDIATWEKTTGESAIQLAMGGSNPRLALINLGNDEKFRGKLIVDITEGLFFRPQKDTRIADRIKYFYEETPAQKISAQTGSLLESQFVFLDETSLALVPMLDELKIKDREGVRGKIILPAKFAYVNSKRQSVMTDEFVNDTLFQKRVKDIWVSFGLLKKNHGVTGDTLQKIFAGVKTAVDKIKARGGKVVFTRTPTSGEAYREMERINFPRAEYFDKLLSVTGCTGIYFDDYPDLRFTCPEWSHLKPSDAVLYTRGLIKILGQQGWFGTAD